MLLNEGRGTCYVPVTVTYHALSFTKPWLLSLPFFPKGTGISDHALNDLQRIEK